MQWLSSLGLCNLEKKQRVGYGIIYKTSSAVEEVMYDLTVPVHSKCCLIHFVPESVGHN